MTEIIQSAWWLVYYIDRDGQPKYLIIKRFALSRKVERVAPKGKIQSWEKMETAVLREVGEEAGIPINQMTVQQKVWIASLRNTDNIRWHMNKDVTYFLVKYAGKPEDVQIEDAEGYTWAYKRATIQEILTLIYYQNMRELFRDAHNIVINQNKKKAAKQDFIDKYL